MDLAHCCLGDCYFLFCYLSLTLHCICLEEQARQSHLAALINTVHSVRRAYQFPASALNKSGGRIWLLHLVVCLFIYFFLTQKSTLRQCHFICTQSISPLPFTVGMQVKQWQCNYKERDFYCIYIPLRWRQLWPEALFFCASYSRKRDIRSALRENIHLDSRMN